MVEPLISQKKEDNKNPSRVTPGEIITYTLKTEDSGAANVSAAHESTLVDHVPAGLIPLNPSTHQPIPNEAIIPLTGGAVWNSTTRTITKALSLLKPGVSSSFTYQVEVENPAVARGMKYLIDTQTEKGLWDEQRYTATGFPRVFYLRYHGYSKFFPLWALARYRNLRSTNSKAVGVGM